VRITGRQHQRRSIEALLEQERRSPNPPDAVRDSVRERIQTTLGAEIGKAQLLEHRIARPRPPLRVVPKVARPVLASLLAYAPLALASLGAVGIAGGVVYMNMPREVRQHLLGAVPGPATDRSAPSLPPDPEPKPASPTAAEANPSVQSGVASDDADVVSASSRPRAIRAAPQATAPAPLASVAGRDRSLAEESALLERARFDVQHGSGARALQALAAHERRFPEGRMLEQREALTIQALIQTGRRDEASRRAKRFRERFPGSLMLQVIQSALDSEEP
jgi:hypothetical protein